MASGSRVLILGDSLSAAYNISMAESWPVLMQQKLGATHPEIKVINASISGETSGGGLKRLPALLKKHLPDYVIVELGGNDGLRGQSFKTLKSNLNRIIELSKQQQSKVLLISVRMPPNLGPIYNRRFQQAFEQVQQKHQVAYLPRFLEGVAASDKELMLADGIHPSAKAQPILANKVYQALLPLID